MERIRPYTDFEKWKSYAFMFMANASLRKDNNTIIIESSDRVLAQWMGYNGYVSEGRTKNRLWKMLLKEDIKDANYSRGTV